ncbi:hypothetical protein Hanom_Chr07g00661581 [Helianthus anomalus]
MESGTPCKDTTSSTYSWANFSMLKVSFIGRKWADLVNRSTITQIASFPFLVLGNLVTKSIVMSSHFHTGISNCCSRPEGF